MVISTIAARERQLRRNGKLKFDKYAKTKARTGFGICPICELPHKRLAVTKSQYGPLLMSIKQSCDHCALVIIAEVDHAIKILRADSYDERREIA